MAQRPQNTPLTLSEIFFVSAAIATEAKPMETAVANRRVFVMVGPPFKQIQQVSKTPQCAQPTGHKEHLSSSHRRPSNVGPPQNRHTPSGLGQKPIQARRAPCVHGRNSAQECSSEFQSTVNAHAHQAPTGRRNVAWDFNPRKSNAWPPTATHQSPSGAQACSRGL